jgi:hypothetical protein
VPRRLLTTALGAAVAALAVLGLGGSAEAAKPAHKPPVCPMTIEESSTAATAVFSGRVTDVTRSPRTDGLPGALYDQTVVVDTVYRGKIHTETVTVQTDRNRTDCSLGKLRTDTAYMFFVTGSGDTWVASGRSGTRPDREKVTAKVVELLGQGSPPIGPAPETATFSPVDTSAPQPLSRAAAPGAALVLVGLLGLAVVRFVRR